MKDYTYNVARIKARETTLMTAQDMDMLISAAAYGDALRILRDKGYDAEDDTLASAERGMWELLSETADAELLGFLRLPIDYHNVKAAVKAVFSGTDSNGLFRDFGTADKEIIFTGIKNREYGELPRDLALCAEDAMTLLLRTQDGQLCDIFIDNSLHRAEETAAKAMGDGFLIKYAAIRADLANLRTAVRCARNRKTQPFTEAALYRGGTLDTNRLAVYAAESAGALADYILSTDYSGGAQYIKSSPAAFERWCSDEMMSFIDSAKYDHFTCAPIVAYAYAKQTELDAVRLVLAAKRNGFDNDTVRERVRRLYV